MHRRAVRTLGAETYEPEIVEAWASPADDESVEEFVDHAFGGEGGPIVFVAVDGDRYWGFSEVEPEIEYLRAVYVDPEMARSGLGRSLLRQAEWAAAQEGAERLELESSRNAVGFYEAQGYDRIGEDTHQIADGLEMECVRFEKKLPGPGI